MKHFLAFLKATLLGGVIVVFPAWLAVLLVLKAVDTWNFDVAKRVEGDGFNFTASLKF